MQGGGGTVQTRHTCLPGGAEAAALGLWAGPSEERAGVGEESASHALKDNKGERSCCSQAALDVELKYWKLKC